MSATARSRAPAPVPATLLALLCTLVGLIVLAWAVLFVTKGRFLRPTFERLAGGALERRVSVGGPFEFYFAPFSLHVRADGLRVGRVEQEHAGADGAPATRPTPPAPTCSAPTIWKRRSRRCRSSGADAASTGSS